MSPKRLIFIFLSILMPLFIPWPAGALLNERPYVPGELLVKFKPTSRSASVSALQHAAGVRQAGSIGSSQIQRIHLSPDADMEQALAIYANDPDVEFVEPNYLIKPQTFPDDTHFARQWGLYNSGQMVGGYVGTPGADMDIVEAWNITTGDQQVVVAVVDTGCDVNHPDLAANIWSNPNEIPGNGVDDDGNGFVDDVHGWDFADNDNTPLDATGHGTHVAGIIAAGADNSRGIAGVAWQTRIMPVRFMNALEVGTTADAIRAIMYALEQGARIINCSWGTASNSFALRNVIDTATHALFICAAGNTGVDADDTGFYPASYPSANIISVAAGDQMDRLAWFSNFGTTSVDVVAPGIRIYSLDNGRGIIWSETFNDGLPDGWISGGEGDSWEVVVPPGSQAATALASSPNGDYANHDDNWARSPVLDLSAASASMLTFRIMGSSQVKADYLTLEISNDGANWHSRPLQVGTVTHAGISGTLQYWATAKADLGPWDAKPQVYIRFRFNSDSSGTDSGFFIDDITLSAGTATDQYQFMRGTSMAAGFVSGLAALIQSENPTLPPIEVKSIIHSSVDLKLDLYQSTLSGGRVNALNALTLLREISLSTGYSATDTIHLQWITQAALDSEVTVERRAEGEMDFSVIGYVDAQSGKYEDNDVSPNTTYYYRVEAMTEDGRCGYSNQILAAAETIESNVSSSGSGGGGSGGCFIADLMKP